MFPLLPLLSSQGISGQAASELKPGSCRFDSERWLVLCWWSGVMTAATKHRGTICQRSMMGFNPDPGRPKTAVDSCRLLMVKVSAHDEDSHAEVELKEEMDFQKTLQIRTLKGGTTLYPECGASQDSCTCPLLSPEAGLLSSPLSDRTPTR
ncbi:unnamed protein product [Lota lota]